MKLSDWLQQHGIGITEFAGQIGRSHSAVSRYASGKRRPDWATLERITTLTGGAVSARDFFDSERAAAEHSSEQPTGKAATEAAA